MSLKYDIQRLYIFFLIIQSSGIRNAAKILHVSPGAVSSQLKKLEEELGFKLFQRDGLKLISTEQAKNILPLAEKLFSYAKVLDDALQEMSTKQNFTLKISGPTFPAHKYLTFIVKELAKQLPQIDVQANFCTYTQTLEQLENNEIHIALLGKKTNASHIKYVPFMKESIVLVVDENHPLTENKYVSLKQLSETSLILHSQHAPFMDFIQDYFKQYNIAPNIVMTKTLDVVAKELIQGTQYATFFSKKFLKEEIQNEKLTYIALEKPLTYIAYFAYLRENVHQEPLKTVLEQYLCKYETIN